MLDLVCERDQDDGVIAAATDFVRGADAVGVAAWLYEFETDLTLPSRAFCDLFDRPPPGDGLVPSDPFRAAVHPEDRPVVDAAFARAVARGQDRVTFTHRLLPRAERSEPRWLRANGRLLRPETDRPPLFVGTVADVTEEHATAARLAMANQEASHRIKNNLAIVASMLALEGSAAKGARTRERFARASDRVRAIADVHDLVARAGGREVIDFGGYLGAVCEAAGRAVEREGVAVRCEAAAVPLHVDVCVRLALLINEFVTNAVQHAFPGGRKGEVRVTTRREAGPNGDDALVVVVADDGVGKPAAPASSVGSLVTSATARRLGAQLEEAQGRPGHTVTITLPLGPDHAQA